MQDRSASAPVAVHCALLFLVHGEFARDVVKTAGASVSRHGSTTEQPSTYLMSSRCSGRLPLCSSPPSPASSSSSSGRREATLTGPELVTTVACPGPDTPASIARATVVRSLPRSLLRCSKYPSGTSVTYLPQKTPTSKSSISVGPSAASRQEAFKSARSWKITSSAWMCSAISCRVFPCATRSCAQSVSTVSHFLEG